MRKNRRDIYGDGHGFVAVPQVQRTAPRLFTPSQLDGLREQYATINRVDPDGEAYPRMTALLDAMPREVLEQIAGAKIKWLSSLALNRLNRKTLQ